MTAGESVNALLASLALPAATEVRPLVGRGFDHAVFHVVLADGRQLVVRRRLSQLEGTDLREEFLQGRGLPCPVLVVEGPDAVAHAFVPGQVLGDLIEQGQDTDQAWRAVGRAYAAVHRLRFPPRIVGEVTTSGLVLRPEDPVDRILRTFDDALDNLQDELPGLRSQEPRLRALVERCASRLRSGPTSLRHGDVNMWNVLVDGDRATLVDWDGACVGDPCGELALIDKHAALFNGIGVPPAFFEGYGRRRDEPVTTLHRITETMVWAASADWAHFESAGLDASLIARARRWRSSLLGYLEHLEQTLTVIDRFNH